MQSDGLCIVK